MDDQRLKQILEAALLVAGRPLAIGDLERLFSGDAEAPPRDAIRRALAQLGEEWGERSLALQEVASGFRAQVRDEFEPWVARLWDEKPPRYSRALLETLAIIAYRQPITRSEIEEIRGVSVSTQIMRTLSEREWVRVVGHREAPGKPAMYGTTRQFLDHFNLKTLDQLPPLGEIREMDGQYPELAFEAEPGTAEGPEGGSDDGEAATAAADAPADTAAGTAAADDTEAGRAEEAVSAPDSDDEVAAGAAGGAGDEHDDRDGGAPDEESAAQPATATAGAGDPEPWTTAAADASDDDDAESQRGES